MAKLLPPTGRQAGLASSSSKREAPGPALFEHDRGLGTLVVAGADEAGRGCLAGPLVAAAVAFEQSRVTPKLIESLRWLNDSKRVSPVRRAELLSCIFTSGAEVSVAVRPASVIDREGLQLTNIEALSAALGGVLSSLTVAVDEVSLLTDGFSVPVAEGNSVKLIKGDSKSAAIAAASIVAKQTRDQIMVRAAERWPGYGFESHVGYASEAHRDAIRQLGPSPIHRMSFNSDAYNAPSSN